MNNNNNTPWQSVVADALFEAVRIHLLLLLLAPLLAMFTLDCLWREAVSLWRGKEQEP